MTNGEISPGKQAFHFYFRVPCYPQVIATWHVEASNHVCNSSYVITRKASSPTSELPRTGITHHFLEPTLCGARHTCHKTSHIPSQSFTTHMGILKAPRSSAIELANTTLLELSHSPSFLHTLFSVRWNHNKEATVMPHLNYCNTLPIVFTHSLSNHSPTHPQAIHHPYYRPNVLSEIIQTMTLSHLKHFMASLILRNSIILWPIKEFCIMYLLSIS